MTPANIKSGNANTDDGEEELDSSENNDGGDDSDDWETDMNEDPPVSPLQSLTITLLDKIFSRRPSAAKPSTGRQHITGPIPQSKALQLVLTRL